MTNGYQPIENYGVIGNLETVALIGIDGSIDFCCFPEFDSPSIFASLLDSDKGGRFSIAPSLQNSRPKQSYLPNTNILLTRFLSPDGVAEVVDFMPVVASIVSEEERSEYSRIVRRAKCIRGEVRFQMFCQPKFDYARASHQIKRVSETEVLFVPDNSRIAALRLRSQTPLQEHEDGVMSEFVLSAGQRALFVLELDRGDAGGLDPSRETESFKQTLNFWQGWIGRSNYAGRWREIVDRSALVLKLLTSRRFGSIPFHLDSRCELYPLCTKPIGFYRRGARVY
jgi:GH15 family glucan-1,4-alpha-glucosidase